MCTMRILKDLDVEWDSPEEEAAYFAAESARTAVEEVILTAAELEPDPHMTSRKNGAGRSDATLARFRPSGR